MKDADYQLLNKYARHFKCPKCNSSYFGTNIGTNIGANTGRCHGDKCDFTWNRDDDGEYFFSTLMSKDLLRLLKLELNTGVICECGSGNILSLESASTPNEVLCNSCGKQWRLAEEPAEPHDLIGRAWGLISAVDWGAAKQEWRDKAHQFRMDYNEFRESD